MNTSKWESLYRQVGIPAPPKIKLYNIPRSTGSNASAKSRTGPIIERTQVLLFSKDINKDTNKGITKDTKKDTSKARNDAHKIKKEISTIKVHKPLPENVSTDDGDDETNKDDVEDNVVSILMTDPKVERRKGAFPGTTKRPFSAKFPVVTKDAPTRPKTAHGRVRPSTAKQKPKGPQTKALVPKRPATAKNTATRPLTAYKDSPISKSCTTLSLNYSRDSLKKTESAVSSGSSTCLKALTLSRKYNEATMRDGYTSPALSQARSSSYGSPTKMKVHRQFSNSTTLHCSFPLLDQAFVLKGQHWNDDETQREESVDAQESSMVSPQCSTFLFCLMFFHRV